jgi:RNA polymerase sigma-70 factor (ECF subfamily)
MMRTPIQLRCRSQTVIPPEVGNENNESNIPAPDLFLRGVLRSEENDMPSEPTVSPRSLDQYRSYLVLLARLHWNPRLQRKLDPSDVAQQALVQAWQKLQDFRGQSDGELRGWLRSILTRCLADCARDLNRAKRDLGRECSLEAVLTDSSQRLEAWLDDQQSSPEERAQRNEQFVQLAEALEALPEAQQEAVTLFHLHDWSVAEIAQQMAKTPAAIGGLLKRGLKTLRVRLEQGE